MVCVMYVSLYLVETCVPTNNILCYNALLVGIIMTRICDVMEPMQYTCMKRIELHPNSSVARFIILPYTDKVTLHVTWIIITAL